MRHWHLKDLIARAHEMTAESLSAAGVLDTPQAFVLNPDILSVDFDVGLAGTMAAGTCASSVGKDTAPAKSVLHFRD